MTKILEILKKAYNVAGKILKYLGVLIGVLEKEAQEDKKDDQV